MRFLQQFEQYIFRETSDKVQNDEGLALTAILGCQALQELCRIHHVVNQLNVVGGKDGGRVIDAVSLLLNSGPKLWLRAHRTYAGNIGETVASVQL